MRRGEGAIPVFDHDYRHALITAYRLGPHREITLDVRLLVWHGSIGKHSAPAQIRFGAVDNFDEVAAFCTANFERPAEVAFIRYSTAKPSKFGHLFIDIGLEREIGEICVVCGNLVIAKAGDPRPEAHAGRS